jgi:hypothetical protein
MTFGSLHGPARRALLAGVALGVIALAPAAAEAKRIKIRTRSDPGEAWLIGRGAVAPTRAEAAAAGGVTTPGRAEAAQARARAALAAERAAVEAAAGEAGRLDGTAGPEAAVCIAGC